METEELCSKVLRYEYFSKIVGNVGMVQSYHYCKIEGVGEVIVIKDLSTGELSFYDNQDEEKVRFLTNK